MTIGRAALDAEVDRVRANAPALHEQIVKALHHLGARCYRRDELRIMRVLLMIKDRDLEAVLRAYGAL